MTVVLIVGIAAAVVAAFLGASWWSTRRALRATRAEVGRLTELAIRRADQISVLSHEVRTPLALIKGSADLLLEESPGPLTDDQRRFAGTIADSAGHVAGLAEMLLIQARIEAGLFEVHLRQVELQAYLRTVVRELRQVHEVPIVLDTPGPPTRVSLDPHLISQLIGNLVANSIRHDPGPGNTVTVRGQLAESDVIIAISDRGRGMTEEQRAQLFKRFTSSAPLGEGTGIGLYVSRHIAELHGGAIHVDTIASHGTTMLVCFPARRRHG